MYRTQAEMRPTSLAFALNILEKAGSTFQVEDFIRALRELPIDINLLNNRLRKAEDCPHIASKLNKNLRNEQ